MRRALAVLALVSAPALHGAVPGWVREAAAVPVPAQKSSAAAVVLLDQQTLTVEGAAVTTRHRRVLKVLTPAGRELAYAAVFFEKTGKVLSMRGWVLDGKGGAHELRERDATEASATTFELYSDTRVKVLRAGRADAGSIVAFETEQRSRPYESSAIWRYQETVPVLRARFELHVPEGVPVHETLVHAGEASTRPARAEGRAAWEVRDVPAIESEPRSPGPAALGAWMGVSWGAKRTWNDVAGWFASLAATQLGTTPELTAKAKELGDVRSCARFAQLDVRYVAVDIGIGGYQPHAAAEVFRNRFGDCKDKATLLRAMLAERGVESHYILVHTTRGVTEPSFPTIAAFNHVIAAVQVPLEESKAAAAGIDHPKLGPLILFDPTSTTTPFGDLPPYLQGGRGLLVTTGELIELPVHAPEAAELRRVVRMQLDDAGALRGTVVETRTGAAAAWMRGQLQPLTAADRIRFVESSLAHHLGHHTTSDVKIEQLEDPAVPLVVRYSVVANDYAARAGDLLLVRPRVLGAKGEGPIDPARKYPYETEGPSLHVDDVEIVMPATVALDELPSPVLVATPHLRYTSESAFENGVLRYRRRYEMKVITVPPGDVAALNAAFARIAADERASAVFK